MYNHVCVVVKAISIVNRDYPIYHYTEAIALFVGM